MRNLLRVKFVSGLGIILALICLSLSAGAGARAWTAAARGPEKSRPLTQATSWKISNIMVREYDQGTGTVDDLDLNETHSASANAPYGPILIVVEVTGELEAGHGKSIVLTATQGRKRIFSGTYGPGPYQGQSADGKKFYAPFWIPSNGLCDPIIVSARTLGQRPTSTLVKTIKIECGE